MADWQDVMTARAEADAALRDADSYGGVIEERGGSPDALAALLGARAVCRELRALAMALDRALHDAS